MRKAAHLQSIVLERADGGGGTIQPLAIIGGGDGNDPLNGTADNDTLSGLAGNDTLSGQAGNDRLDGGLGNDSLIGGSGNDTYVVNTSLDVIVESSTLAGEIDTVEASLSWTLLANLERLVLTGSSNLSGTGNSLANTITGNSGRNSLSGAAGNDTLSGGSGNDTLNGGTQNDSMTGGSGNDSYVVDASGDKVVETGTAATEIDSVSSAVTLTLPTNVEKLTLTGSKPLNGTGNGSANTITGNTGANVLSGGGGNDTLLGGSGNDSLGGSSGNDSLDGGTGNDTMSGGSGNDVYHVDVAGDITTETGTSPTEYDIVVSAVTRTLGANLESLTLTGSGALNGTGNSLSNALLGNTGANILSGGDGNDTLSGAAGNDSLVGGNGNDTLSGSSGNDTLSGGTGNDLMSGGSGNDSYSVDATNDVVDETGTSATEIDRVSSSATFTLRVNIERLTLTGSGNLNGTGNAGANTITGNTGNNTLAGLAGNDTLGGGSGNDRLIGGTQNDSMTGGSGNDSYDVDSAGDIVNESSTLATEIDSVNAVVSWVLGANLENLTQTGGSDIFGTGNALANTMTGNGGANILSGEGGNDSLTGGSGNDTLNGGDGADTLTGGAGNDSLTGGAGNDSYVIDAAGDSVTETGTSTSEIDSVSANISFTLGANVENLLLTGSDVISGTGNGLKNKLTGNGAANILLGEGGGDTLDGGGGNDNLQGGSGNDSLLGNSGNDTLDGGTGNDTLDGGIGNDAMTGGGGNDRYRVDAADDTVIESGTDASELDTVETVVTYTLAANVERLQLKGSDSISGSGNALANQITGNGGANTLSGAAGNDTLDGGAGADSLIGGADGDRYVINDAGDVIDETGANTGAVDTVASSVDFMLGANLEVLMLTGNAALAGTGNGLDNTLLGNTGANLLDGGAGNDSLDGGLGADTLAGGAGNDVYQAVQSDDTLQEAADAGFDTVQTTLATFTLGDNLEALTFTGTGDFSGSGNGLANLIETGAGNDSLEGGAGNDTLRGGAGDDTYVLDSAADLAEENLDEGTDTVLTNLPSATLGAHLEDLAYTGVSVFAGTGNGLANRITGGALADALDGAVGIDTLTGGAGSDLYFVDNPADQTIEQAGGGSDDEVRSTVSWTLSAEVERLELLAGSVSLNGIGNGLDNMLAGNAGMNSLNGADGNDSLLGNAGIDTLTGGTGDDLLDGGSDGDVMTGGGGNDSYRIDSFLDTVTEQAGGGTDTINAAINYTLDAEVELLQLTGSATQGTGNGLDNTITGSINNDTLSGAAGNDTLSGAGGNDTLDGGLGNDLMAGGSGNDRYIVDSLSDSVAESAGAGTADEVLTALAGYTLAAEVEKLVYTGAGDFNGTGNGGNNSLTGGAGKDILNGGLGADTLTGLGGNDEYVVDNAADATIEAVGQGSDTVKAGVSSWTLADNVEHLTFTGVGSFSGTGNAVVNTITGGAGNDTLSGGAGRDSLIGGLGDDTYVLEERDFITELAGGGIDTLQSSVDPLEMAEAANVENGVLLGALNLYIKGNALDNRITGNSGNNELFGVQGNDSLVGGAGNDRLDGDDGNDTLDGGTGNDNLEGFGGNDFYVVDSILDVLKEAANAGTDIVVSTVDWTLGPEFENLAFDGQSEAKGKGNALGNLMTGNSAKNLLEGLDGNDSLRGSGGDDDLQGDNGNDTLIGSAGNDVVSGDAGNDSFVLDSLIGSDTLFTFVTGVDKVVINMLGIPVGNGNTTIDAPLTRGGPGGWSTGNELVLFTTNLASLSTTNAASAIGNSDVAVAAGARKIFVVDNGSATGVYLFTSSALDQGVSASELTLLATLSGTPATATSDYLFGS